MTLGGLLIAVGLWVACSLAFGAVWAFIHSRRHRQRNAIKCAFRELPEGDCFPAFDVEPLSLHVREYER